ncbi:hypothetical protein EV361DRAFT_80474 [Lentinula raphanica]|nr:hypothetical protein EV361DRAFT_80474 [Lentinula raphanica]
MCPVRLPQSATFIMLHSSLQRMTFVYVSLAGVPLIHALRGQCFDKSCMCFDPAPVRVAKRVITPTTFSPGLPMLFLR